MSKNRDRRKPEAREDGSRSVQTRSRKQPRKDNASKRVNFDNTRASKFEKDMQKADCNDPSWYAANAELMKAAASYNFATTVGQKMPWLNALSVPGICTLKWVPFIGTGAPVQQAMNQKYSFTVHANSRNYAYNAPDQFMLILAGASLFSAISHGIRAYGIMRRFSGLDYYTPQALVTAMNFDYNDLRNNLPQMWFDLNEMISRSRQIWIPNDMPLIERWFWLNANIYKDGDSEKSQYYMFEPAGFWKLNETGQPTGTSLDWVAWDSTFVTSTPKTWQNYKDIINSMFDALLNSEDRGIMFGDLLKAYGADRIYTIGSITSDYSVEPTYNVEVLSQIENATIYPALVRTYVQENGTLGATFPESTSGQAAAYTVFGDGILNFHFKGQPTPEQIMVATRLRVSGIKVLDPMTEQKNTVMLSPNVVGSEYIYMVNFWANSYPSGASQPTLSPVQFGGVATGNFVDYFRWLAFDWAPWVYSVGKAASIDYTIKGATGYTEIGLGFGDYDNYVWLDHNALERMHTVAIYSELGVYSTLN